METKVEEIWKDVVGYEGLYQISNLGFVKTLQRSGTYTKILNPSTFGGYSQVTLSKNNERTTVYVHRITAKCFVQNPFNLPQVNHKDGDKLNNNISNLEWCTASENINHSYKNRSNTGIGVSRKKRPLILIKDIAIIECESISHAIVMIGGTHSGLRHAVNGRVSAYLGFTVHCL